MKRQKIMIMSLISMLAMSGCSMPEITSPVYRADDCAALQREMRKTDRFIAEITPMDAALVEERMDALPVPSITTSANKARALKDAQKHKVALQEEWQSSGCAAKMAENK